MSRSNVGTMIIYLRAGYNAMTCFPKSTFKCHNFYIGESNYGRDMQYCILTQEIIDMAKDMLDKHNKLTS